MSGRTVFPRVGPQAMPYQYKREPLTQDDAKTCPQFPVNRGATP